MRHLRRSAAAQGTSIEIEPRGGSMLSDGPARRYRHCRQPRGIIRGVTRDMPSGPRSPMEEPNMHTTRRDFVKAGLVTGIGASIGFPAYLRHAWAADPIKIGLPAALSGGNAQYGVQAKRACELFAKDIKAKGGVLGRPV